jgi:hypothetical protein
MYAAASRSSQAGSDQTTCRAIATFASRLRPARSPGLGWPRRGRCGFFGERRCGTEYRRGSYRREADREAREPIPWLLAWRCLPIHSTYPGRRELGRKALAHGGRSSAPLGPPTRTQRLQLNGMPLPLSILLKPRRLKGSVLFCYLWLSRKPEDQTWQPTRPKKSR